MHAGLDHETLEVDCQYYCCYYYIEYIVNDNTPELHRAVDGDSGTALVE